MSRSPFALTGRAAIVTGSTYGIGWSIAEALAEAGCAVVLNGRKPAQGEEKLAELRARGADAIFVPGDMAEVESNRDVIRRGLAAFPQADILVTNAGSFFDVDFVEMTPERFDQTFALNVRGQFFAAQEFVRHCRARDDRGGRIILMASANAVQSEQGSAAYDASKGAIAALARALACDLGQYGFTVNALGPGLIRTPLTGWLNEKPEAARHYEYCAPLGRIGLPSEIGPAAVFLASDAGQYMTGQLLLLDGGLTAQQIPPAPGGIGWS